MSDEIEKNIPTEPSDKDLEKILLKSDPEIFDDISDQKKEELVESLKQAYTY